MRALAGDIPTSAKTGGPISGPTLLTDHQSEMMTLAGGVVKIFGNTQETTQEIVEQASRLFAHAQPNVEVQHE